MEESIKAYGVNKKEGSPKRWEKEVTNADGTRECMYVEEIDYNKKTVFLITENKSGKEEKYESYYKSVKYISDVNPLAEKKSFLSKLANYVGESE